MIFDDLAIGFLSKFKKKKDKKKKKLRETADQHIARKIIPGYFTFSDRI